VYRLCFWRLLAVERTGPIIAVQTNGIGMDHHFAENVLPLSNDQPRLTRQAQGLNRSARIVDLFHTVDQRPTRQRNPTNVRTDRRMRKSAVAGIDSVN
jgi:hypothetical protein